MDLASYSKPDEISALPRDLERKGEESEVDYVRRLKQSVENQCIEIQDLGAINAIMTEALAQTGNVSVETLKRDHDQTSQLLDSVESKKAKVESDLSMYQDLNEQSESVLKMVIKVVKNADDSGDKGGEPSAFQVRRAQAIIKGESFEEEEEEEPSSVQVSNTEAANEREAKVNSLMACVGQEQSKVEKLSERLLELREDVDKLLEGIRVEPERPKEGEENEDNAGMIPQESEENEENSGLSQQVDEDEDISEVPQENEENEDNAEFPDEDGENEDIDGLPQDTEENEDEAELPEEDGENEDIDGFPQDTEENEDEAELPEEDGENEDTDGLPQDGEENEDEAELPEENEEDYNFFHEDRSVEQLLDLIKNADRREAMDTLTNVLAYREGAVLEFLVAGIPVLISVLKEERDLAKKEEEEEEQHNSDMAQSALGVLNNAFREEVSNLKKEEFQLALTNVDLLSRDSDSISMIISYLEEQDNFFLHLITFGVLNGMVRNFPNRLPETILGIPNAITQLVKMVTGSQITTQVLKFLTKLARQSEEIKKKLITEGVYDKIYIIIEDEEGLIDDEFMVEACFKLLRALLHNTEANQKFVMETIGFTTLLSALKLQGVADSFNKLKVRHILGRLKTINQLITEDSKADPEKSSSLINKTALVQENILDHLLMLSVQSLEAPVAVRCSALRCIGDLIRGHPKNLDALASKVIGEEPQEPALNSILRFILKTSSRQEFAAADYVFKSFCEKNPKRQAMLAPIEDGVDTLFGSALLRGFRGLETSCRAASVLSRILQDNNELKKTVLGTKLEAETIMQRILKQLALASFTRNKDEESEKSVNSYFGLLILKLLIIWLYDSPEAVNSFLELHPGRTYLVELLSNESESAYVKGLAAVILGLCVIYNDSVDARTDAFSVLRSITHKVDLESYFTTLYVMQISEIFVSNPYNLDQEDEDCVVMLSIFDADFITLINKMETDMREKLDTISSNPKSNVPVVPDFLEQKSEEIENEYIGRIKEFVEKQCSEIQDFRSKNAVMALDLANTGGVPIDTLVHDLREKSQQLKLIKSEKAKIEVEEFVIRKISDKFESVLNDVNSYYSGLKFNIARSDLPDIEAIKAETRVDSLTIWLGYEKTKVDKLSARLFELGEDVDKLLGNEVSS